MRTALLILAVLAAPGCAFVLDWDFDLEPAVAPDGGPPVDSSADALTDAPAPPDAPDPDAPPVDAGCTSCPTATAIAAGDSHTLAIDDTGRVWCWGDSSRGQCGVMEPSVAPRVIDGVGPALEVIGGAFHSCARTTVDVFCWGENMQGELARARIDVAPQPEPVAIGDTADSIGLAAGTAFTCVLRGSGTLRCAGTNVLGQLGRGTESPNDPVLRDSLVTRAFHVVAGDNHGCALIGGAPEGDAQCWGSDAEGQLGTMLPTSYDSTPRDVVGAHSFQYLAAGGAHTCGVIAGSGSIFCWGDGTSGQLGTGSTADSDVPVAVIGLDANRELGRAPIAAGASHTCAIDRSREVRCWGENSRGQLGTGDTSPRATPAAVMRLTDVDHVTAGDEHTCAIAAGEVFCWGNNREGQLGSPAPKQSPEPIRVELR